MKQYLLTVSAGKRLIGKAMAQHPAIEEALNSGTLVIIAGSTNGYVAEEVLASIGQDKGFTREGFHRGLVTGPGQKPSSKAMDGDVVIKNGKLVPGATIFDVADDLRQGDVILKGANAYDAWGVPAVQIGHPQGGTILAAMAALIGRRVQVIVPVGLEKRVLDDMHSLATLCNAPDNQGPRLYPFPGQVFTEIDAIALLTDCETVLLAAGGTQGAEGSVWLGVEGEPAELAEADRLLRSVAKEPPCSI